MLFLLLLLLSLLGQLLVSHALAAPHGYLRFIVISWVVKEADSLTQFCVKTKSLATHAPVRLKDTGRRKLQHATNCSAWASK